MFVPVDRVGGLGWRLCDLSLDEVGGRFGEMMFGGVRMLILIQRLCLRIGHLVVVLEGIRCGLGVVRIVDECDC